MHIPDFRDRKVRLRKIKELAKQGVIFIDKERTYIESNVVIGEGTIIYPDVYLSGGTRIGRNCVLYAQVHLLEARIGDETEINPFTIVENSEVGSRCKIGPKTHIRNQSVIGDWCEIGATEVVRSVIGAYTKAKHTGYVGDATIGEHCNIGDDTTFCNYDGIKKHPSVLGNHVFTGSGTKLVAPIEMGDWSATGANTTLPKGTYERHTLYYPKDGKLISKPNPLVPQKE